ncbi:MAG TPA: TylF/MycF/NovP-related O-methyltransferase [Rhodopila sp.]
MGVLTAAAALFKTIGRRSGKPHSPSDAVVGHLPDEVPVEEDPPAPKVTGSGQGTADITQYGQWTQAVFGQEIPVPGVLFAASFAGSSVWGQKTHEALLNVELAYVELLCRQLKNNNVPGALVEFGVFEGWWINHFFEVSERVGLDRPVIGYDSFQGLSSPHPTHDEAFWKEGQYSASLKSVSDNVKLAERDRIKLIPGFFSDSLQTADALSVGEIAYARIDCDIYEPALDCLRYLSTRLADGAVLVLDDWPHRLEVGETRAFRDWAPTVPHLRFEFLFFGTWGHFYTRVWHDHPAA